MDYGERNQLFANDGTRQIPRRLRTNPAFCGTPNVARGLAGGDLDGDGALDLVVTTVAGRARIYRNVAPDRGHWLIGARGRPAPRARRLRRGSHRRGRRRCRWIRSINPGDSYLSSSDRRAHFGLGNDDAHDAVRGHLAGWLVRAIQGRSGRSAR